MQCNLIKGLVKVFRVWRNKETLKMECNKCNRNYIILFSEIRIKIESNFECFAKLN